MIGTVFLSHYHIRREPGYVRSIGRTSYLIVHHRKPVVGLCKVQHGFHEVPAVYSVDPLEPYDKVPVRQYAPHFILAVKL